MRRKIPIDVGIERPGNLILSDNGWRLHGLKEFTAIKTVVTS